MKKLIIGSTQYKEKFLLLKEALEFSGHEVKIPAFDDKKDLDDLGVCLYNLDLIKWADEVHLIWDNRSPGAIFDMGMVFALNKPLSISYIEDKTFAGVFKKYANR